MASSGGGGQLGSTSPGASAVAAAGAEAAEAATAAAGLLAVAAAVAAGQLADDGATSADRADVSGVAVQTAAAPEEWGGPSSTRSWSMLSDPAPPEEQGYSSEPRWETGNAATLRGV